MSTKPMLRLFLGIVVIAQVCIAAPGGFGLTKPGDAETGLPIRPKFTWGSSSGALSYKIQVGQDSKFDTYKTQAFIKSATTFSWDCNTDLLTGSIYYWRVIAYSNATCDETNPNERTMCSDIYHIFTTLGKPTLSAPDNAAKEVARKPEFTWTGATGAGSYKIQVCLNTGFSPAAPEGPNLSSSITSWSPDANLNLGTTYYWRVIAYTNTTNDDATTKATSDVRSFTTTVGLPPAPTLVSPADNLTGVSNAPTLSWTKNGVADYYEYQVSTTTTFTDQPTQTTLTSVQLTDLFCGQRYYWQVREHNVAGYGPYSVARNFVVRGSSAPLPGEITCNVGETQCQVSDSKIWRVRQIGNNGCWCSSSIVLLQCKAGAQDETGFQTALERESGISCTDESKGLFDYCVRNDVTGMKYLLNKIGGIATDEKIFLPPPSSLNIPTSCYRTMNYPTSCEIQDWIKNKKPFAISLRHGQNSTLGHVVIVYGYGFNDGVFELKVFDPLSPLFSLIEYSDALDINSSRILSNALVPQLPLTGGISGILSIVDITSGPTTFTHPAAAGTYTCQFINKDTPPASASSFSWRLSFKHADGLYTAASVNNLSGINASTWAFSGFTLPAGYNWTRNEAGSIMGKVVVSTYDSDNDYHADSMDVAYTAPQDPAIPVLTSPANGTTDLSEKAYLQWQPSANATSYRLQITKSTFIPQPTVDMSGLTATSYQLTDYLLPLTPYQWRVCATNSWGTSPWSVPQSFTIRRFLPLNITYENVNVSTPQANVEARNSVTVRSDAINTGASVYIGAGNAVNMYDGVAVQNGATMSIAVDPALR